MNWGADNEPSFKFGFQLGGADSEVADAAAETPAVPVLAGEELTQDEVQQAVDAADVRAPAAREQVSPDCLLWVGRVGASTCIYPLARAAASDPSGA